MGKKKTLPAAAQKQENNKGNDLSPVTPDQTNNTNNIGSRDWLPAGMTKISRDLARAKVLIYGPPKIGKTTLASHWPGAWFVATEPGQDWIKMQEPTIMTSWDDFLAWCNWVQDERPSKFRNGTKIRTMVFDTVDLLFKLCSNHICAIMGVGDPSELDYGKGWAAIGNEFQRVICNVVRWPYGMVFISHSSTKQIKSKSTEVHQIIPSIMTTGLRIVHSLVDIIMYCYMDESAITDAEGKLTGAIEERRRIRCAPKNNIIAGDRTGCLPDEIDMDYDVLLKCFPDT
jgi:hypothetical protein